MMLAAAKQLLKYTTSVCARTMVTRDIGQPTNYTHPEVIAPGESKSSLCYNFRRRSTALLLKDYYYI